MELMETLDNGNYVVIAVKKKIIMICMWSCAIYALAVQCASRGMDLKV